MFGSVSKVVDSLVILSNNETLKIEKILKPKRGAPKSQNITIVAYVALNKIQNTHTHETFSVMASELL